MDEFFEPDAQDPDRRREPDVFSYRLGHVEAKAERNEQELLKLERLVHDFIAAMPANFVPRQEFDKALGTITELASDFRNFMTTVNTSNAIRERMTWNWRNWIPTVVLAVVAIVALFVHH